MSAFLCVVLSCVGTDLATGLSPILRALPKCLNAFIISEVDSESEVGRGPNP